MRVALLSTFDCGGAGRAALKLCRALRCVGIESRLFVKHASGDDPLVEAIGSGGFYRALLEDINLRDFVENIHPGNTMLSLPYGEVPVDLLQRLRAYDVIHLQWVAQFISTECLLQLGKPLLWTLHDQHALTGACHYAHGCVGYRADCGDCPQMADNRFDAPHKFLAIKQRYMPRELVVVTPGNWLAECARNSAVFRAHRIEIIQYPIELEVFAPRDKTVAKMRFGIAPGQKVILFGAEHCGERRKGFEKLLAALAYLKEHTPLAERIRDGKVTLLLFGRETEAVRKLGIPFVEAGYVGGDENLAWLYNAADVLALPSLEDNMPLVMLEAMACGTPVVGFDVGGMRDCIEVGCTGDKVACGDAAAFARAMARVLLGKDLSNACRRYAETHFSAAAQARAHQALYEALLRKTSRENAAFSASSGAEADMLPETFEALSPYLRGALQRIAAYDELQQLRFLCGAQYLEAYFRRLLQTKLQLSSYGKRSVAIWGTGDTARKLLAALSEMPEALASIRGFFDGKKARGGEAVFGRFELLDAARATEYGLRAIVIASQKFEAEIYRDICELEQEGIRVICLFSAWQEGEEREQ